MLNLVSDFLAEVIKLTQDLLPLFVLYLDHYFLNYLMMLLYIWLRQRSRTMHQLAPASAAQGTARGTPMRDRKSEK